MASHGDPIYVYFVYLFKCFCVCIQLFLCMYPNVCVNKLLARIYQLAHFQSFYLFCVFCVFCVFYMCILPIPSLARMARWVGLYPQIPNSRAVYAPPLSCTYIHAPTESLFPHRVRGTTVACAASNLALGMTRTQLACAVCCVVV